MSLAGGRKLVSFFPPLQMVALAALLSSLREHSFVELARRRRSTRGGAYEDEEHLEDVHAYKIIDDGLTEEGEVLELLEADVGEAVSMLAPVPNARKSRRRGGGKKKRGSSGRNSQPLPEQENLQNTDVENFRRIDMNHGFMKSIVRNQIDRDEYHKFMEERRGATLKKLQDDESKHRKKATTTTASASAATSETNGPRLYVPPHMRREAAAAASSSREEADTDEETEEKKRERRARGFPGFVSELEESDMREKIRTRIRAQYGEEGPSIKKADGRNSSRRKPNHALFTLNLIDNDGRAFEVDIMSDDNAARLAKGLGRKHGFTDDQCRLLRLKLESELETRLAKEAAEARA